MSDIVRFGVSLDKTLLEKFDHLIKARHYTNRSEAFRDMIRQELVKKEWEENQEVVGAVTIVYDHHQRTILHKINDVQHDFLDIIISTQHIHLDHDNCCEIIAVRGASGEVQRLSDTLKSIKGVRHETLNMSSTGKAIV
ncbi:MAG TPA: nickel-responsive transcriptional regulator NikR [Syntrophales bacterium]|nr:nickel-responsive transcriptional regulator NikR [Syntrophales bacterium]HPQ43011.1 nickel-responsive transcriptional regulator NikR [Syntrophales bacterium]